MRSIWFSSRRNIMEIEVEIYVREFTKYSIIQLDDASLTPQG